MKRILLLVLMFTHVFIAAEGILLARSENFIFLEKEAKAEVADEAEILHFRETLRAPVSQAQTFYFHHRSLVHHLGKVSSESPVLSVPFFILHGGLRT